MNTVVVVGNAPLQTDHSELVNSADVVVRFNDCKAYTPLSGARTSILCISNTGGPARRALESVPFRRRTICNQAEEIWFPRDEQIHKSHIVRNEVDYPLVEFDDLSSALIVSNGLSDKRILRCSSLFNIATLRKLYRLKELNGAESKMFICPSTGFLGVEYLMSAPQYYDCEVHLIGFGFDGWGGHPWAIESCAVEEHVRSKRLILHPA